MRRLFVLITVLAALPALAQLTPIQQDCVVALNKDGAKVAATQAKESLACLKAAGKGTLTLSAQACLTADPNLKLAGKKAKTTSDEAKFCGTPPAFGYAGAAVVNAVAQQGELNLIADLFGSDLDSAAVPCAADPARCKCQGQVLKAIEKLAKLERQLFVRCKTSLLENAASAADLGRCIDDAATAASIAAAKASGGKVDNAVAKLSAVIARSCDGPMVTAASFPGACDALAGGSLTACLAGRTACRVCQTLNDMDALSVDCDAADDGIANDSCSGSVYPEPTPTPTETALPTATATPTVTPTESLETLDITFRDSGSGRVVDLAHGIDCTATCSVDVPRGTVLTLTGEANGEPPSLVGGFYKWAGACSGTGTCVTTMDAGASIEAWFAPHTVRIVYGPEGISPATIGLDRSNSVTFRVLAGLRNVSTLVLWETSPAVELVAPGQYLHVVPAADGYAVRFAPQIWKEFRDGYVLTVLDPIRPGWISDSQVIQFTGNFYRDRCEVAAPGTTGACYTHFSPTRGIGLCRDGVAVCESEPHECVPDALGENGEILSETCFGTWGACVGQVQPSTEICGNGLDENCNGLVDDGCP